MNMRTHLEFRSTFFPIIPGEDEEVNEGIYGKALADFLARELEAHGYVTDYLPEDWGWYISLEPQDERLDFRLWIGCSSLDENYWIVHIHPDKPYVRKWFKKIHTEPAVQKVAVLVERLILEKADGTALKWLSADDRIGEQ